MIEFEVACLNPFDGRPSAVRIRLDGESDRVDAESEPWCRLDFLQAVVRRAFTAAGRAWWDSRCVYCSQPGQICDVPWLQMRASEIGGGTWGYAVPVNMDLVDVSIADRTATLAPKGYPPNAGFYLSEKESTRIRGRMEEDFGGLSREDIGKIYRAFDTVYVQALVKDVIYILCHRDRSCKAGVSALARVGSPRSTTLCPYFFGGSETYAASALIEELLHGYASIAHSWPGHPLRPVDEANTYQAYLMRHYLTG
jgi:hypothetical protein